MERRFVVASAIAVVVAAAFLSGSGVQSSAAAARGVRAIPAGLANAIHARFGAGAIRKGWAARAVDGPRFGYSVVLSADGTTALVGAPGAHHDKGAAYIYHVSDAGSWTSTDTPTAVLTNGPGPNAQLFGLSIALSPDGTTAFVGAPLAIPDGNTIGAIYSFHVSAEDAWASSSTPDATLTASGDLFVGISLAVSPDGTTLVAGSPFYNSFAGGAYVFQASSEDAWASTSNPTATLDYAGESAQDFAVGDAVAISGDGTTVLLGDPNNPNGGGGFVFHVAAEDAWEDNSTPTAVLSDTNSDSYDSLGAAVALSGDGTVAFLGAPVANYGHGAVDVFRAAGEAAWASTSTPTATLTNAGGSDLDLLGVRIQVSSDGTTAFVTAPNVHGDRGAAYIFHVADEASWASSSAPTAILTNSAAKSKDDMGGAALSADGATALGGAPGVRYETGAADVFHVADATSWVSSSTPAAILTNSALNSCVVPRLKKLTVRAAKAALKARSCSLGRVRRVHATRGKRGHVLSQSLKPGSRPPIGTKVSIRVKK